MTGALSLFGDTYTPADPPAADACPEQHGYAPIPSEHALARAFDWPHPIGVPAWPSAR